MKTKYWVMLIAGVLAMCLGLSLFFLIPRGEKNYVRVVQDGAVTMLLDLGKDQTLELKSASGGVNVIRIQDGKIGVIEASCPDHICMAMGYCSSGAPIACLPNGLILAFSDIPGIDGAAG